MFRRDNGNVEETLPYEWQLVKLLPDAGKLPLWSEVSFIARRGAFVWQGYGKG